VNLDFSDERDMIRKFRTSLALQPVATALFANSPFCDGQAERVQEPALARVGGHGRGAHRHARVGV
jgi:hypothetical protein